MDNQTAGWTTRDIPDQSGRTALITGGNSGLGYQAVLQLARKGARVLLAARDRARGTAALERLAAEAPAGNAELAQLDLADLACIERFSAALLDGGQGLELLINNAGVMAIPHRETTAQGYERQFGTNHLGHFALTGQLLDNMLQVEGSRVVTVSSVGHRILARIHFDDLQLERRYNRVEAYGQSKLANLLFTYELQRRLTLKGAPTIAAAAHPGFSDTELMRHLPGFIPDFVWRPFTQPADMGALPTLRAATDPGVQGGQYYGPDGIGEAQGHPKLVKSSAQSHNEDIARRLWTVSEELTGVTYPV